MANPVYVRYLRTRLTDSTIFRKKQKEPKIELCELWSHWEADLWKMQKAFAVKSKYSTNNFQKN